jgi:hypothetical protein
MTRGRGNGGAAPASAVTLVQTPRSVDPSGRHFVTARAGEMFGQPPLRGLTFYATLSFPRDHISFADPAYFGRPP